MTNDSHGSEVLRNWYQARAVAAAEWAPAVLVALLNGPQHYTELLSTVGSFRISDRWTQRHKILYESTLTRTLKQLTDDGLIERRQLPGVFPQSVRYTLTPAARDLVEAITPMAEWADRYANLLELARNRRQQDKDIV